MCAQGEGLAILLFHSLPQVPLSCTYLGVFNEGQSGLKFNSSFCVQEEAEGEVFSTHSILKDPPCEGLVKSRHSLGMTLRSSLSHLQLSRTCSGVCRAPQLQRGLSDLVMQ